MTFISHIVGVSALSVLAGIAQADVAVIINPGAAKVPSQAEVANIFLGKDKSLKGFDLKGWNATKETFYAQVTSKNEAQLKSYWSGLIFTGKGQPLATLDDDAAVVARVASDSNAIGYVDSQAVTGSVKVLFTLR
ncbi:phosphate ABC transporter substrate-binding protein [Serpens gallinarum]|uniref:Phosphate ABC transporter substrate-binding protein n=1 Tax=Serpens gallinarum TaxID=2763075 RepID=A0ABR8TJ51_9PSED|nr:phosphate ABC transporter substrate-binding protein [Serpens gallinarum]MBD7975803.1 phosphate ABC transporter substrate-binding protein [Serpens gallinarum]